jgi:FkbM family methyltransferase
VLTRIRTAVKRPSEWERRAIRDARNTAELLRETVRPTSVAVDVGAHKGSILQLLVNAAPSQRHHAFEPLPDLAAQLRDRYPTVIVHECALGNQNGEAEFFRIIDAPGWSGLHVQDAVTNSARETLRVPLRRLDDILNGEPVHFIKIDVEGAELGVLQGASATLGAHHPVIMFEHATIHAQSYGTTAEAVYDELAAHDYTLSALGERTVLGRRAFAEMCAKAAATGYDRRAHTNWVARGPE